MNGLPGPWQHYTTRASIGPTSQRKATTMTSNMLRGLSLTGAVLFSMIIGLGRALVGALTGDHVARALITGAATFGTTLALAVIVLTFLIPTDSGRDRARRRLTK
jgi:hypothetical protein